MTKEFYSAPDVLLLDCPVSMAICVTSDSSVSLQDYGEIDMDLTF